MRQLARRASLVVVVVLLASVGTASAECAWLLWRQTVTPLEDWAISQAHSTVKECSEDLLSFARSLKSEGYEVTGMIPGLAR